MTHHLERPEKPCGRNHRQMSGGLGGAQAKEAALEALVSAISHEGLFGLLNGCRTVRTVILAVQPDGAEEVDGGLLA
jgi:hypothetical protein